MNDSLALIPLLRLDRLVFLDYESQSQQGSSSTDRAAISEENQD